MANPFPRTTRSLRGEEGLSHLFPGVAGLASDSSFDEFFKRVEPRLKRMLLTYRIPSEDAEDLLQQSLLALLYRWQRVRDPESWLAGTLKRHCLMYWRNQRRRIYSAVDTTILELLSRPVAPPQQRVEMLCDLESLIGRLPPRCRSLLQLRFRLGYKAPEVAAKLGYRASSIGKITIRCLAALWREMLISGLADEPELRADGAERRVNCQTCGR